MEHISGLKTCPHTSTVSIQIELEAPCAAIKKKFLEKYFRSPLTPVRRCHPPLGILNEID